MALLDLPAAGFTAFDGWLSSLVPPAGRIALWALLGALASMLLYRLLSPQAKIAAVKREAVRARARLKTYDGDFAGAWPLMRAQLATSFHHIGLVLPATLAAFLPLLALIVWLDSHFSYHFPPFLSNSAIETAPPDFKARWIEPAPAEKPRIEVRNGQDNPILEVPIEAPVPTIHKRQWWNTLIANPAGYLPDEAPIERIDFKLPAQELIPVGPSWARTWEIIFFPVLILGSLAVRWLARIE